MFGLGRPTVYHILWQVIDAINKTPAVGQFNFPADDEACLRHAERFRVSDAPASLLALPGVYFPFSAIFPDVLVNVVNVSWDHVTQA